MAQGSQRHAGMPVDQPSLIDIPAATRRCARCGAKAPKRCRWCDKQDIPRPGTPGWRRWTRGLSRTIRARLEVVGLGRLATDAVKAVLFDGGGVPSGVAPLVADIVALPCSRGRYQDALERALNAEGLSMYTREEQRQRRGLPTVRVAVPRVRVAVDDEITDAVAAEHEAEAIDEAMPRRSGAL